jgi:hypothetical protein
MILGVPSQADEDDHSGTERRMTWQQHRRGFIVCFGCGCLLVAFVAHAKPCAVDPGSIAGVRIGASKQEVVSQLSSRYSVTEEAKAGSSPTLVIRAREGGSGGKARMVIGLDSDRVFLIDSYEKCITKEGIGPGVHLGRAEQAYGVGRIDPTDTGYFVWFDNKDGVMFLIDQHDIPVSLRGIPDDAITPAQERRILNLKSARIVMARVTGR